jgi:NAD(P)-dependent dehydrogenase (short-subunit alcohol dehydrogenase family)
MADPAWRERTLPKYPLGRFGTVDDVAAAILYLASDDAAFVTGVALPVEAGTRRSERSRPAPALCPRLRGGRGPIVGR